MVSYDAFAADKQTALLCRVRRGAESVVFQAGDTANFKFYLPDGTTITRACEIVEMDPLLLRYRFVENELTQGQWRFRAYLVWTSANWEGYCQTAHFDVGPAE